MSECVSEYVWYVLVSAQTQTSPSTDRFQIPETSMVLENRNATALCRDHNSYVCLDIRVVGAPKWEARQKWYDA